MLEELKIMLGERVSNYTEEQLGLCLKKALAEVEAYCMRALDYELENVALDIAIIKLNRLNSEGVGGYSANGVSESYINGYPVEIQQILNRKRKLKVL